MHTNLWRSTGVLVAFAVLLLVGGSFIAGSPVWAQDLQFSVDPDGHVQGEPADENSNSEVEEPRYAPGDRESRDRALGNLYAYLATAENAEAAQKIATAIERIWLDPSSATISVLMERAIKAAKDNKTDLAMKLMNAVVKLAPDYAEGWNRRAFVFHMQENPAGAMSDLQRALALDPNHFKALDGVSKVLLSAGKKKAALKAMRQLQEIHPHWSGIAQSIEDLAREVEGQGI